MPSRLIIRSFLSLAAVLGIGGASAHAGIIVTVGKPCPEISVPARKPNPDNQRQTMFEGDSSEGTRCVVMPDGSTRCGKSIRVETLSMLPPDWRCVTVTKTVLYCETPTFGASPGSAGAGGFDPDADGDYLDDDEQIETLGCSGGADFGGIAAGIGGMIVLFAVRRRRA